MFLVHLNGTGTADLPASFDVVFPYLDRIIPPEWGRRATAHTPLNLGKGDRHVDAKYDCRMVAHVRDPF